MRGHGSGMPECHGMGCETEVPEDLEEVRGRVNEVVHLQGGATPKLQGNTLCRKLGRLLFFFGEADFLQQVWDGGENEAKSTIFLSWFSVFDSADGDLLWDKMDTHPPYRKVNGEDESWD
ncbi:hypothetical protein QYF61_025161 [Mycteria americana]|uniref:Uncharacterized protein n=1 Tax=Mycteria americana TaxID=33587 RepID=A0AAN7SA31_MYCAM|nr:hypothetical protein QYF61_025161 [Mycteria americana]